MFLCYIYICIYHLDISATFMEGPESIRLPLPQVPAVAVLDDLCGGSQVNIV
jgi:hypothetical protein